MSTAARAPRPTPAIRPGLWRLPQPTVKVTCSRCSRRFVAPDLRREPVVKQRVKCTHCGRWRNAEYRALLQQRDEREKLLVHGGRVPVFTKVQLFLIEAAVHATLEGTFDIGTLREHIRDAVPNVKTCLSLGLMEEAQGNAKARNYRLTNAGRDVLARAVAQYGLHNEAWNEPPQGDSTHEN